MSTCEMPCGLCDKPVTDDDHYKELDCTYPKCPGRCYHEDCIDRYLRKRGKGSGTEQRTRYPCPATLSNGEPCPGTIRGTHNRVPVNQKKKEQNREAAVTAALAVNRTVSSAATARNVATASAAPATKSNAKAAGANLATAIPVGALKGTTSKITVLRAAGPVVGNSTGAVDKGTKVLFWSAVPAAAVQPAPQPVLSAWSKVVAQQLSAAEAPALVPGGKAQHQNQNQRSRSPAAPASRDIAHPERVVRQRVAPERSGSAKALTLEEQRAVVAALKAEAKGAAVSNGSGVQPPSAAGPSAAAGAASSDRSGTGPVTALKAATTDKSSLGEGSAARRHDAAPAAAWAHLQNSSSYLSGEPSDTDAALYTSGLGTAAGGENEQHQRQQRHPQRHQLLGGPSLEWANGSSSGSGGPQQQLPRQDSHLDEQDFPALSAGRAQDGAARAAGRTRTTPRVPSAVEGATKAGGTRTTASVKDDGTRSTASVKDDGTRFTASVKDDGTRTTASVKDDGAAPSSPSRASLPLMTALSSDSDPVLGHDPLYMTEDGAFVVQDAFGNYVQMEYIYGVEPEVVGFQDGDGNVTYYVVVRQSWTKNHTQEAPPARPRAAEDAIDSADDLSLRRGASVDLAPVAACCEDQAVRPLVLTDTSAGRGPLDVGGSGSVGFASAAGPAAKGPAAGVADDEDVLEDNDEEDVLQDLLALCLGNMT